METKNKHLYERLPQVGELLGGEEMRALLQRHPRPAVLAVLRDELTSLRHRIRDGGLTERALLAEIDGLSVRVAHGLARGERSALRPVINATGVILQTNLGRAPLSDAAVEKIAAVARGYCNLEFELESGQRGRRGAHAEEMLLRVLEATSQDRAALVVNNCAAAAFLALNSLAEGGEVIVSRGELVEIGGGFRVPEILRKSGARLVEVGTTNRTRLEDYAAAITAETRMILRVHRSNFQIVGFTEQPELAELVGLGARAGVPVMVDQGSGCVEALERYGLQQELSLAASVESGAAVVCASGDKLLGGPQCGLIVGQRELMQRLCANPLYRALRVDKLTLAALESTLEAYLSEAAQTLPTIRMMALDAETIRMRCARWAAALCSEDSFAEVVPVASVVGGGTTPGATLAGFGVALAAHGLSADALAEWLRKLDPPVIARIHEGRVLLDLRTVPEDADGWLPEALTSRLHARMVATDSAVDALG